MPVLLGKLHKAWRLLQCLALPAHRQTRFDHRTKTEHRATILLPNPVAAHDTKPDVMDGPSKFLKENRTAQNRSSPAKTAVCRISSAVHVRKATGRNRQRVFDDA